MTDHLYVYDEHGNRLMKVGTEDPADLPDERLLMLTSLLLGCGCFLSFFWQWAGWMAIIAVFALWWVVGTRRHPQRSLREQRRWADMLLLENNLVQIGHRIPVDGDTFILEDYYGAGIFSDPSKANGQPCRIVKPR